MKIHEYQAKEILEKYGLPTPKSVLAANIQEVKDAAVKLKGKVVVKSQVQVGGRGKAGGVKLAKTPEEAIIVGRPGESALDEGLPMIFDLGARGLGQQLGQLVLETFPLRAGQRHIARVGANVEGLELLAFVGRLSRGTDCNVLARR